MEMVLKLPKNYVDVADDEMEYVEGGQIFKNEKVNAWVNFAVATVSFCISCAAAGPTAGVSLVFAAISCYGMISAWSDLNDIYHFDDPLRR